MISTWIARSEYFGWLRPYSFILVLAFLLAFISIWIRFKKRNLPTRPLELGFFIILPFSILGASFFGKLSYKNPIPFLELFAFWEPGLSIHGGLIIGGITGGAWFYKQAPKYRISLWTFFDLIMPSILIGQGIGRWGNFFNHEILGVKTSRSSLWFLPNFIKNSCFKWHVTNGGIAYQAQGINGNPVDPSNFSNVQYYQPLFLYESFLDILLFFIIVFLIPYVYKLIVYKKQIKQIKNEFTMNKFYINNFYDLNIEDGDIEKCFKYSKSRSKYLQKIKKIKKSKRLPFWWDYKKTRIKELFYQDRRELLKLYNPNNIKVIYAGLQGSLYIIGYNLIRFFLETQRVDADLFIINLRVLDYIVIWLFILIGVAFVIFSQFIAPKKWRLPNWYYEKQW